MLTNPSRIILLAFVLHGVATVGYPIPPQPIGELTVSAKRIVYARVVGHQARPPSKGGFEFNHHLALLEVLETWKGDHEPSLRVAFAPGMACPAPARYEVGRNVVAFLEQRNGVWETAGLSYGTRYPPSPEALESIRSAVRAFLELQNAPTPSNGAQLAVSSRRRADLLVAIASNPATRWDGLYALASGPGTLLQLYGALPANPGLTTAQQATLAQGYLEAPTGDETLLMVVQALRGYQNPGLEAALATAADRILAADPPNWSERLVLLLRERLLGQPVTEADWKSTVGAFLESRRDEASTWRAKVRDRWAEVKRQSGIRPSILKDFVPVSEVEFVGGGISL